MLIKNAEALERLEKVDTLVVDKTGTLTEGKPKVVAIVPAAGFDEDELLRLAASLERASEHPLAAAIVAAAEERELAAGRGRRFRFADRQGRDRHASTAGSWLLGNARLPGRTRRRHRRRSRTQAERLRRDGATAIFVAVDGKAAAADRHRRSGQGHDAGGARGAARKTASASSC